MSPDFLPYNLCAVNTLAIILFLCWRPGWLTWDSTSAGLRQPHSRFTMAALALAMPVIFLVNLTFELLPPLPDVVPEMSIDILTGHPVGLLALCIIGPLAEELVFRAGVQGALQQRLHPAWAIVAAAALFALIHFNPVQMLPAFAIGLLLGWAYWRSGSIVAPAAIHVLNNSVAVVGGDRQLTELCTRGELLLATAVAVAWIATVVAVLQRVSRRA